MKLGDIEVLISELLHSGDFGKALHRTRAQRRGKNIIEGSDVELDRHEQKPRIYEAIARYDRVSDQNKKKIVEDSPWHVTTALGKVYNSLPLEKRLEWRDHFYQEGKEGSKIPEAGENGDKTTLQPKYVVPKPLFAFTMRDPDTKPRLPNLFSTETKNHHLTIGFDKKGNYANFAYKVEADGEKQVRWEENLQSCIDHAEEITGTPIRTLPLHKGYRKNFSELLLP